MNPGERRMFLGALLVSTFLGSMGQLLFKMGLAHSLLVVLLGLLAYSLSTLIYLYILGRAHLSWTYGIGGLSYIFASILAFLVLGEKISVLRWIGIAVIAIGTVLVSVS